MKTLMFTIYDEKAEVFLPPFFVPTIGIATRAFADTINSADHQFSKHPGDYSLFQLGEFFDHDGSFKSTEKKSFGNGVEYRESQQPYATPGDEHGPTGPSIQPDKTG